jgi:hypothetical protein
MLNVRRRRLNQQLNSEYLGFGRDLDERIDFRSSLRNNNFVRGILRGHDNRPVSTMFDLDDNNSEKSLVEFSREES